MSPEAHQIRISHVARLGGATAGSRPAPREEIGWEKVAQVLLGLGLSITLIVVVIAALLDPEPASKLALAGLSAAMITAILEAFGMEGEVPADA